MRVREYGNNRRRRYRRLIIMPKRLGNRAKEPGKEAKGLTDREARFCIEYMVDMDAKAAAIRAGFKPSTARNAAAWIHPEHPAKPELRKEIDRLIAKRAKRTEVTVERIEEELAKIAFANITDVVDSEGRLIEGASRMDTAAISSITTKHGKGWVEQEIRMSDKAIALKLLGMRRGMFTEKVQIDGPLPVIIDDIGCPEEENEKLKIGFRNGDCDERAEAE